MGKQPFLSLATARVKQHQRITMFPIKIIRTAINSLMVTIAYIRLSFIKESFPAPKWNLINQQ